MSKDFNRISYEDYSATMLTNQVDTIANIDNLVIENQDIIYSTSIHNENNIMHDIFQMIKKKITFEEFVLFILTIIIFVIIVMSSSLLFLLKKDNLIFIILNLITRFLLLIIGILLILKKN